MEARGIGIFHVNLFALECPKSVNIDYWVHLFFLFFVLLGRRCGKAEQQKKEVGKVMELLWVFLLGFHDG